MASNSICTSCLRALRRQHLRQFPFLPNQRSQQLRPFTQRTTRLNDPPQGSSQSLDSSKRNPPPPRPYNAQQSASPSASDGSIPSWATTFQSRTQQEEVQPAEPEQGPKPAKRAAPPPPRPFGAQPAASTSTSDDPIKSFAASVRNREAFKHTTEPYIAYGSTEDLFAACAATCNYTIPSRTLKPPQSPPRTTSGEDLGEGSGWWFTPKEQGGLGLDVTFNSWAQVLYLHMYVLTVRLRAFPAQHARIWHQNLLDHFFYAAEDRMATWHGMSARSVRNKYLKDIYTQWRGILFSYDEGLVRGDAVLASAVWRNVFKANPDTSVADVALVTAYLRQELARAESLSDGSLGAGDVVFGNPVQVREFLGTLRSNGMRQPFTAADEGVNEAVKEIGPTA